MAAMSQIQLRHAEVLQLPREFVVTDRRREIVLRSSSRRRWVMEAVGLRSDGGSGVEEEKKIRPCSYAVGDQRAVGNLVGGGGGGEVVSEAGGRVEGDWTVEVLVAAGVTVVLGVGNRVLYKLALVPKALPFLSSSARYFRVKIVIEPDHIFVNPLPNLAYGDQPVAFPFFYIKPAEKEKIVRKYYPKENGLVTEIDPIASALHGVRHTLRKDFMIQGQLTYGKIGEWRFDKRSYLRGPPPPRNLPLPPPGVPESVARLVKMVNEATANIPGWDKL
ncbi:Hydroxyproline O-arabinosyltransferase 3 [Camellia lanceoleosa]|uniref:Hydroxyproline O-arabinosyltransferase 3 n=1 Tax=Camellia lanceoleosa TaxID=1840588 RepID=A0ACC0FVW4_9ERIC|nr:Hydroxyproline O-arabinosyltransferase 3 [Camellia lanceoleosa]